MAHHITANLLAPSIFQSMQAALATPKKSAAAVVASPTANSSSATDSTGIGSTFLNLLIKELQNQDPSAPMDSTAMVGQMISLNQLDQLISIDQKVAIPATSTAASAIAAGTPAPVWSTAIPSSGATSTAARMTTAQPQAPSLADLFPFKQGYTSAPPEPIFGGMNGQSPITVDDSAFGLPAATSVSGGK
ncbi:MAG TPA: flagellar hook capping FlgD N-terminal domain-containing protein [Acidisarcina sp.]